MKLEGDRPGSHRLPWTPWTGFATVSPGASQRPLVETLGRMALSGTKDIMWAVWGWPCASPRLGLNT